MSNKTAIQIMHSELIESELIDIKTIQLITPFLLRAFEKEKQQIMDAYKIGITEEVPFYFAINRIFTADEYYNETFEQ